MPIDFRCVSCQKLLRVGDGDAGKQAKCPQCGAVVAIPTPPGGGAAVPPPASSAAPASGLPAPETFDNPYRSPADQGPPAGAAAPAVIVPSTLDLGDVFTRAWSIFTASWLPCVGGFLLVIILSFVVPQVIQGSLTFIGRMTGVRGLGAWLGLVGMVAGFVFNFWLRAGSCLYFLKIARRGSADIGDLFSGGPFLLRVLGGSILYGLISLGGYLLLIVPGVIFALMFSQFIWLIIDQNMDVLDSLSVSRQLMVGNKLTLFLIGLVAGVGGLLVTLLTCLLGGIFLVGPFLTLLYAVIYLAVTGQATAERRVN